MPPRKDLASEILADHRRMADTFARYVADTDALIEGLQQRVRELEARLYPTGKKRWGRVKRDKERSQAKLARDALKGG